jgi:hypothetical protein
MDEDEEVEDRPRKKAKKKQGIPVWVWLLLGGGFFFCCCVGVPVGGYFGFRSWFGGVESALEKQKQVKSGMTLKQVEGILGPGKVVKEGKIGGQTTKTVKWDEGKVSELMVEFIDDKVVLGPGDFDLKDFKKP